ncbi:YchJ family metal-binding protein [Micromonospora polyrhachis]|uniref:YchJ family metal-binding protein n=1 Tax=Micromonospora polyrhachis TaxID=1282883 RepID=UPI001FEC9757|nr:YchJ family metal-binding protein [Micromonospora polyrhachis]
MSLDPQQRWTRLEILAADRGSLFDTVGTVEFRAHYRESGQVGTMYEHSSFVRENGEWSTSTRRQILSDLTRFHGWIRPQRALTGGLG